MITEFKINVADLSSWNERREKLRSILGAGYDQICVAYSVWDSIEPGTVALEVAEALLIGETLFDVCESIFPIHVYQPGITPTDHIVFILQIKNLDAFVDRLLYLGQLFRGDAANRRPERATAVDALIGELNSRELHFPELREWFDDPNGGFGSLTRE